MKFYFLPVKKIWFFQWLSTINIVSFNVFPHVYTYIYIFFLTSYVCVNIYIYDLSRKYFFLRYMGNLLTLLYSDSNSCYSSPSTNPPFSILSRSPLYSYQNCDSYNTYATPFNLQPYCTLQTFSRVPLSRRLTPNMTTEHGSDKAPDMEVVEECTVKEVDLTVPKTDDPSLPVLTFRMWVLGLICCVILSFVNQFFWYRTNPLMISSVAAQIAVVPIGHLMARTLPTRQVFEGTRFAFSMNPGPFNIKEHVLITIFANAGAGTVYATHILSAVKLLYHRNLSLFPAFLVMITTQVRFNITHTYTYICIHIIWSLKF